jgi:integrase
MITERSASPKNPVCQDEDFLALVGRVSANAEDPMNRQWRVTKQTMSGKPYWSLQAGARGPERVALALGYVTEAEAERALVTMQQEEQLYGTPQYDRVLSLYKGNVRSAGDGWTGPTVDRRKGQDQARRYLIGDGAVEDIFGVVKVTPNYPNMALRDYFALVFEPHRSVARPDSWRVEDSAWKFVLADIGDVRLNDIDEYVVDAHLGRLRKVNGSPATWNMKRRHRNVISSLLQHARRQRHYLRPMPVWFRLEGSTHRSRGEPETLTLEDVRKLLDASPPQLRAIIAAGVGLGLRPNEILRLRWERIDWEKKAVRIDGTKTAGSAATVLLMPLAEVELRSWHEANGRPSQGLLFRPMKKVPGREGYAVKKGTSHVPFRKALKTAVKKAGMGHRRITPYTLRHSCATLLIEAGVPVYSVAKMLRHTSPKMVAEHYDHVSAALDPELVQRALRLLPVTS